MENLILTRNFSTNDRMLCYNRLEEHFFMDIFYTISKKVLKLTRGNTYYQLFVTDKSFIYVVPI